MSVLAAVDGECGGTPLLVSPGFHGQELYPPEGQLCNIQIGGLTKARVVVDLRDRLPGSGHFFVRLALATRLRAGDHFLRDLIGHEVVVAEFH